MTPSGDMPDGKIRRAGFNETIDSGTSIVAAIRRLIEKKVLPTFDNAE